MPNNEMIVSIFNFKNPKFWMVFAIGYCVASFAFAQIAFGILVLYKLITDNQKSSMVSLQ